MIVALRTYTGRVRQCSRLFAALLMFSGLPAVAAAQTTVVLDASGTEVSVDTTIRAGGYASVNYGTSDTLQVKSDTDSSYRRRILLKFDTQNYVPAGAVINSAQLYLTLKGADDSTLRPIGVYRVTKSFLAREATWLDYRDAQQWSNSGRRPGRPLHDDKRRQLRGIRVQIQSDRTWCSRRVNGTFGSRYTRLVLVDTGAGSSKALRSFHSSRSSEYGAAAKAGNHLRVSTSDGLEPAAARR